MKKQNVFLLSLLLLLSTWAGAEEIEVKVSSDRAAVVHVTDKADADPDVSGTIKAAANLKDGKSNMRADLVLKNNKELAGAEIDFFGQMSATAIEAVGALDMTIPPEPDAPKVLDITGETHTEDDASAAKFNVVFEAPTNGEDIPKGSGAVEFDGDFEAINGKGNFEFSGEAIKSDDIPFKKFVLNVTEVDNKTTVTVEVAVTKSSPMFAQLDMLPQAAPMLEQQLKSANIKYENLDFPAPTTEGEVKTGKAALTIVDLRGTIKPFLGMAAAQMGGQYGEGVDVQKSFEQMLEVRLDKMNFTMEADKALVKGEFSGNLSKLGSFYRGYLPLMPEMQRASYAELIREADEFGPILEVLLNINSRQSVENLKIMLDSGMKVKGGGKFALEPKGTDMAFTADGNVLTTGYKDYAAKAKAAGLPVADKMVGTMDLKLNEGSKLVGSMYLYSDGNLVKYFQDMAGEAAKEIGAPADVQKEMESLNLNNATFKMSLKGDKLTMESNSDSSDLTGVAKLLIAKAAPQVDATLAGAAVDVNMVPDGKADVKVFFTEFLPGKNEAQIKEALGLPSSAKITMEASSADVAVAPVESTEIAIDGKLVAVKSEGQKLLASAPADVASGSGASSGGGGNKWGLIAVGVLLLAGVGGFLAFGKKS